MKQYDYFFYCLGARGDCRLDVKERHIIGLKKAENKGFCTIGVMMEPPAGDAGALFALL